MKRERSLSSSSSDSWSLLEEIDDENDEKQQMEKSDLLSPLTSAHKNVCQQQIIGQMDPLESISIVQLPLDISTALLASQHLLVVSTPASSSIVTQTGAILSPEHSAQALANSGPDSPVLVSPPKSPPIESTFTFLKDPKLRISFSDSCESNEKEDGMAKADEERTKMMANTDVVEKSMDDKVFEQNTNEPKENSPINESTKIENLTKEITEKVEVEIEKAEEEFEHEKVVQLMNKEEESTKMATMEIEAKNEEEESSEPESSSILSGHESIDESIRSSRPEYSSNTSSFGTGSNSPQFDSYSEMEETEEEEEEKPMDMANNAENGMEMEGNLEEEEIESSTISSLPSSMLSSSISSNSLADEQIFPSLPPIDRSIPSTQSSNNFERPEMVNDSNVEMGWTELSISSVSASSTDEANAEKEGAGQDMAMHPTEMVARRFDELSDKMDESLWQRILDETFGSLKNFERSDRIINILIIAMFLTSISSMTILHILENTWIGTNISNSMQSSPRIPLQSSIQSLVEFRADSRQVDDKWNSELRQCKDELIETKHAYESKVKLLHYMRFKEIEQEVMVEELKKELEMAKQALENLQHQQKASAGQIFHLDDSTNGKSIEFEEMESMNIAEKRRNQKMRTKRNVMEMDKPKLEEKMKTIRPEEYDENWPFCGALKGPKPTTIFLKTPISTPFLENPVWRGIVEQTEGRLIAPPATLDSHLVSPPVTINEKKTEDKAIDVQEDLNQYWPSKFVYNIFDDQQASTSAEHSDQIEEEEDKIGSSPPKRAKMEKEDDEEEEMEEENGFGTKMLTNWQKYNEILANLSTQFGRNHMLRSVRNAVVTRLNRTIEKTTTTLAAATKLVTSENFGQNLFTSTVREIMARMGNSGLSNIVDCLNNGIQRIQNIQLCIPQLVDWPILVEENEEEDENEENDEKVYSSKKDVEKEENKKEEKEEGGAKNDKEEEHAYYSLENGNASSGTGGWLLQRAIARAMVRNNKRFCGTIVHLNRTSRKGDEDRFNRWFFARAALRQQQRKKQRNGTMECETRSSLFRDDWMFARQKIRAKLRDKQNEETKENWLFVRQKMREKAREEVAGENDGAQEEKLTIGKENWLFGRQKLRQKLRNEEKHLWTSNEATEEEEEEWPRKKQRKWWQKKEQKKKWKKGFAGKWTTPNFNQEEYYGDNNKFSGDKDED